MDVFGRGKQRGLKVGEITYDELPKEMLMSSCPTPTRSSRCRPSPQAARTGAKGAFGDGKIFLLPVEEAYTVSSGAKGL